jgi:hypothetical protein
MLRCTTRSMRQSTPVFGRSGWEKMTLLSTTTVMTWAIGTPSTHSSSHRSHMSSSSSSSSYRARIPSFPPPPPPTLLLLVTAQPFYCPRYLLLPATVTAYVTTYSPPSPTLDCSPASLLSLPSSFCLRTASHHAMLVGAHIRMPMHVIYWFASHIQCIEWPLYCIACAQMLGVFRVTHRAVHPRPGTTVARSGTKKTFRVHLLQRNAVRIPTAVFLEQIVGVCVSST